MTKNELELLFNQNSTRFLDEWKTLLRFPSVGVDPERTTDCRACAEWLRAHLTGLGFSACLLPTDSHPVVFAERPGKPGKPTVLFYGHYDVQPPDPLDQWQSPPFEPDVRDGRLYARGASDNKGQSFAALKALETLIRSNALDCPMKILLEGDEESGRLPILKLLQTQSPLMRADVVMSADMGAVSSGAPTLTMGLRGIASMTLVLSGANYDLHSGVHGGRAPNPAHGLARLIASLHRDDGGVAVEGFYDGVREPTVRERELANAAGLDPVWFDRMFGVPPVGGETAYTPIERTSFRPALDVNGIHSGYGGAGSKTIIPAQALAKISVRLVPGQDPERILNAVIRHLEHRVPPGLRLEITERAAGSPAVRVNLDSRPIRIAGDVLGQLSALPVAYLWEGASVPIMAHLPAAAGAEPVLVGFGSDADRIHAPNESYSLEQFRMCFLYTALFLSRLQE